MENSKDNKFLGEEKISKLLLKFAIPCILSLLISSLYNIVDQIFIGNSELGYLGNAATAIVFPITIITMAFAWCFGDGVAAFMSLCQGRNDTKNSHNSVGISILVSGIVSLILLALGFIFRDTLLYLFGASNSTIDLARGYFNIIWAAIPVYMIANTLNPIIRADGSPKFSMITTTTGAIINIILDPIFIFVFNWGIEGAALATIIAQFISFILSVVYLFRTKTFKLIFKSFKFNSSIFNNMIKLGVSTFITQLAIVVISLVCNIMLAKYGAVSKYGADIPIAVIGICMKVFTIVINIVVGVIVGAQPILGYNYGAKKYDRVKSTFKTVLFITLGITLIATVIFEFFPQVAINMFGIQSDLYMEFAIKTFRIFLALITCTCTLKMMSIFSQAVGKPLNAAIISLSRDIVFFVPLVIILPMNLGIDGVLWAAPIADAMGIIVAIILVSKFFKDLNKEKIAMLSDSTTIKESHTGVIITISREHGSQGKYVGELIAKQLNIPYYYKELTALAAQESGLDKEFVSKLNTEENVLHNLYLTTEPVKYAIQAQDAIIKKIAQKGSCVIVGRAADYVLKDNPNVISVFIYAPKEYRAKKVMEMYNDTNYDALKNIERSDKARASYYNMISNTQWGKPQNYDLCINSSIGTEATARIICEYLKTIKISK